MDKEWYKIRDLFFGSNFVQGNPKQALELAAKSNHPEAVWLYNAFKNAAADILNWYDMLNDYFTSLGDRDCRAMCYAWLCKDSHDNLRKLKEAAAMGYPLAQAEYAKWIRQNVFDDYEIGLNFALQAAEKNERSAFECLYHYYVYGEKEKATAMAKKAAQLGSVRFMIAFARRSTNMKEKINWFGKAAVKGKANALYICIPEIYDGLSADERYLLGKYGKLLNGNRPICLMEASKFFDQQNNACRKAVYAWSLSALRMRICKDMRIYIAQMIWQTRKEALFPCPQ